MENEVIPESLTVRGTWKQQTTGSIPDFNGIKFTVKTSDGESIRYDDWDSFNAAGGDYSINSEKVWAPEEGTQTITLFLSEYPSIKTSKSVNVIKKPLKIEKVIQESPVYAGHNISPYCKIIVKYSDGTLKEKYNGEYEVSPEASPVNSLYPIDCIFTYSENGFSVFKESRVEITPREYYIEVSSDEGSVSFIKDGMFNKKKISYKYTADTPIEIKIKTFSDNKGFKFKGWVCNTGLISFDKTKEEVSILIPENRGLNINIKAIWDKYFDEYGNKYTIEDGVLKSIDISDSRFVIPEEVHTIEEGFFRDFEIKSIVLPSGLTEIKKETFVDSTLSNIEIPESVRYIGDNAFENCVNLESVKFNQKESFTIGKASFRNCSSLSSLDFLSLGKNLKDCVFGDDDKDVWQGCILSTIKLDKSCFAAVKGIYKGTNISFTGYSGNGFRLNALSNGGNMAYVVYPTEKTEMIDLSKNKSWKFSYRVWDSSNKENLNKRGCSFSTNGNVTLWMEVLGLGHPQFNYATVSLPPCKYSFTDEYGGYVNDLIYPQVKFGILSDKMFDDDVRLNEMREGLLEGGSLLDRMLPVYRSEQ